jgi:hypothetical protein
MMYAICCVSVSVNKEDLIVATNKIDRLNPVVFVRGHVEFGQDVSVFAYL